MSSDTGRRVPGGRGADLSKGQTRHFTDGSASMIGLPGLPVAGVMNPSRKIKTLQDAKRSELYSSETYGDEYGKRAERVNVIKFILAIFGIRTNKKVRERRETNTM